MSATPSTIRRRGLMFVLSSPSGAGKTTISRRLLEMEDGLSLSVSVTTRARRPGEVEGVHYRFVDDDAFARMVAAGELLEHARIYGRSYGTPAAPVRAALADGRDVLFDIEWRGAAQLRALAGDDVVGLFILPPSLDELEHRLRARGRDSEDEVRRRLAQAAADAAHWAAYDYVIVNADLEAAIAQTRTILAAERLRRRRQTGLAEFIQRSFAQPR